MAKRKQASSGRSRKTAKPAKPAKPAKAPKAVDEGSEGGGMPIEAVASVFTAILLLTATILVMVEMGKHYGEGMFSGMYEAEASE